MEQRGKTIFRATLTGSIINAALIIMKPEYSAEYTVILGD